MSLINYHARCMHVSLVNSLFYTQQYLNFEEELLLVLGKYSMDSRIAIVRK